MRSLLFPMIVIITVVLFSVSTQAQETSMWIADMEVRLGMPELEVTKKLLQHYNLTRLGDNGGYLITSKQRNSSNEYDSYGVVSFTNNKLSFASKNWHPDTPSSDASLADAIFSVVSEVENRGERVINMRTNTQRGPEFKIEEVIITFAQRQVTVSKTEYKGSVGVQVSESIRLNPRP
jgi:hypothetical protein